MLERSQERATMRAPLRGRLMVGRLTLDQVVKVRVLAPQLLNELRPPYQQVPALYGGGW
jgi:hypothetical protein